MIECPACATRYRILRELGPHGALVTCPSCGHLWVVHDEDVTPEPGLPALLLKDEHFNPLGPPGVPQAAPPPPLPPDLAMRAWQEAWVGTEISTATPLSDTRHNRPPATPPPSQRSVAPLPGRPGLVRGSGVGLVASVVGVAVLILGCAGVGAVLGTWSRRAALSPPGATLAIEAPAAPERAAPAPVPSEPPPAPAPVPRPARRADPAELLPER